MILLYCQDLDMSLIAVFNPIRAGVLELLGGLTHRGPRVKLGIYNGVLSMGSYICMGDLSACLLYMNGCEIGIAALYNWVLYWLVSSIRMHALYACKLYMHAWSICMHAIYLNPHQHYIILCAKEGRGLVERWMVGRTLAVADRSILLKTWSTFLHSLMNLAKSG